MLEAPCASSSGSIFDRSVKKNAEKNREKILQTDPLVNEGGREMQQGEGGYLSRNSR